MAVIVFADQSGYLPITDLGKFKNRVSYNLAKLEADARSDGSLDDLMEEIGRHYEASQDPRFSVADQDSRFQTICLQYESAYYARILWNRANNKAYSTQQLNKDLVVFAAAFPSSHLADDLQKVRLATKPGAAKPLAKTPVGKADAPAVQVSPTPVVPTREERFKVLIDERDFVAYQAGLEQFKRDYPKATELDKLEERLVELNIEYLKASHQ